MPTTANFSLEYPDDNSSVDIAGHFETLADDVDNAINTRLALTGGTLTGSLSGTSLSLSSTLSVTGNSTFTGTVTGSSTTDSSSSTTGAFKTAGGMGIAKALYIGTTLNVTGATTLTGTLNGKVVNDIVTGPASATDNALVRFDSTTGKVVQNSGITVDDSGYVTSNLTMSKSAPRITINSPAGDTRYFRIQSALAQRWAFGGGSAAESGSNAGTDFVVLSYTDAEAFLRTDLTINRATGKWTVGSAGATAGLEYGSSGPRDMVGTGSPEGVVTAPVGSTWRDTNATTGAIKWIKATGTGNTGWVVEYGDTGWRKVAMINSWSGSVYLRRIGATVHMRGWNQADGVINSTSASSNTFVTVASGFIPSIPERSNAPVGVLWKYANPIHALYYIFADTAGAFGSPARTNDLYLASFSYLTADAWPSSLPGSAV